MKKHTLFQPFLIFMVAVTLAADSHAGLRILDRPMWVFPGQTFRITLEQPPGMDNLVAQVPSQLQMFDTWPKDAFQRFYFRAVEPGKVTLRFSGKAGTKDVEIEVIPWSGVFEPREHENIQLPRIWPLDNPEYRDLKNRRSLHTEEDLRNLRSKSPGSLARAWYELSDDQVFNIVPGPDVPRTCLMVLGGYEDARGKGCPTCGTEIYKGRSGFYPWIIDPENHPWKVGCPSCNSWFPSNDYQNGDMHSGDFPDDGYGCEPVEPVYAQDGKPWRWPFIAYYHQTSAYMRNLTRAVPQCAEAYIATGDKVYAHKAAIGLFRLAESLLDLSINLNHRKIAVRNGIYKPPVGAPDPRALKRVDRTFLYIQPNWDTPRLERCARAWDLIFDQLEGDQELLEFCQSNYHPEIRTIEDFRWFIESGLIRVTAQACLDDAVSRNYPMQEVTIATMALALNTPRCEELVDWVLNGPGGIRFGLTNEYFKDGAGHESESYNGIGIRDMTRLLVLLDRIIESDPDRYRPPKFVSMLSDPKFRTLYDFPLDNNLIGRTYPGTGDTGGPRTDPWSPSKGFPLRKHQFAEVFRRTRDARFAQALLGPDGKIPGAVADAELRKEIEAAGDRKGWQVATRSGISDGYGHAILRSGKGDRQRAMWLRYGRTLQHAHPDMLTFGLAALQRNFLPELGYPQGWTYAGSWESNWATHYGTHIVGVRSRRFQPGKLTLFADSSPAKIAVAESSAGQSAWRERTIVLVDLPDENCYAVTLERVRGGTTHHHSFHGPDGDIVSTHLNLIPQAGGTLLGEGLEYGDDALAREKDRELSSFAFLYDVRKGNPNEIWEMDVALRNQEGVHLRKAMVHPADASLSLAKGKAPGGGQNDYEMTWAVLEREGDTPLESQFLYVLEPYEGSSSIRAVERVSVMSEEGDFSALGLRVITDSYTDHLVFQDNEQNKGETEFGLSVTGTFGFLRQSNTGRSVAAVVAGGSRLGHNGITIRASHYKGTIRNCDWSEGKILVQPAPPDIDKLQDRHLQIHNDSGSHASYLIKRATRLPEGCEITLGMDPKIGAGFVQEISDGAITSHVRLRLSGLRNYYAGKTLSNEDGTSLHRLKGVTGRSRCEIEDGAPKDQLKSEFVDKDGDGLVRYVIYDYGPGDRVTIAGWSTLNGKPAF